jgi:ribose transport system substrate-binding protein
MKRIAGILLVALAAAAMLGLAGCGGKPKELTVGYIMPGPDPWYGYAKDGFVFAAEKNGVKVQVVNSDYDQQKEQANIDDLITKKVDGINLFSFNSDAAQIAAQKANKAKIPLTIEMTALAEGPGTIVTDIEFDWVKLGETLAEKIAEKFPGEKVLEITGIIGTGPIDNLLAGMKGKMAELGKNELVGIQPADYNREKAMNIMQNMLASKKQFTVVHVSNEDMAMGVIQVLKDAKKLNNPIKVVSNNGSPEGLESIKAGDLSFTISTSPGVEGLTSFEALYRHLRGKKVPAKVMIPIVYIDKENVDKAVAWKVDDAAYELVKKLYDDLGAK